MAAQRASWLTAGALLAMSSILALQYTKQAMLPRTQNPNGVTIQGPGGISASLPIQPR